MDLLLSFRFFFCSILLFQMHIIWNETISVLLLFLSCYWCYVDVVTSCIPVDGQQITFIRYCLLIKTMCFQYFHLTCMQDAIIFAFVPFGWFFHIVGAVRCAFFFFFVSCPFFKIITICIFHSKHCNCYWNRFRSSR